MGGLRRRYALTLQCVPAEAGNPFPQGTASHTRPGKRRLQLKSPSRRACSGTKKSLLSAADENNRLADSFLDGA